MNKKKKSGKSVSEVILELGKFLETPRLVEEIKKEIKDNKGHNFSKVDVSVNLLYLLRRDKIKRKKEGKIYKYYTQNG